MNCAPPTFQRLFGLFELDADGTIIYSRQLLSSPDFTAISTTVANPSLVGRNFFDEVAPFKNVEEFRRHFKYFMKGAISTENFVFDCNFGEDILPVKVKMAQISEREFNEKTRLVIVDIRKI